jgi:hypothetical protein
MQVLEDHHQRLIERLAQQYPLDSVECAPLAHLRVHLRQRIVAVGDAEQAEQVRQGIFEAAIERDHAACNLFTPLAAVVAGVDTEVAVQEIDHRKIRARFAVRD